MADFFAAHGVPPQQARVTPGDAGFRLDEPQDASIFHNKYVLLTVAATLVCLIVFVFLMVLFNKDDEEADGDNKDTGGNNRIYNNALTVQPLRGKPVILESLMPGSSDALTPH